MIAIEFELLFLILDAQKRPGEGDPDVLKLLAPRSYDIFISYKSHDVRLARAVADQLISAGKRVWFAEYEILLKGYEKFQEAIDRGISRSQFGLAFTNDNYAESEHWRREMRQLLERCTPARVLEVRIPEEPEPHRLFPSLVESPAYIGDQVNDILAFVSRHTGWSIPTRAVEDVARAHQSVDGVCMDWRYRLDATGWIQTRHGSGRLVDWGRSEWREPVGRNVLMHTISMGRVPVSFEGPELRLNKEGPPLMMNLHAGPEFSGHARTSDPNPDDREMYRELMAYLPKHLGKLGRAKMRGLHLFFHVGRSQFVVTYQWSGYWTRKYSIMVQHPKSVIPVEFVFTFGFKGSFEEYCRRTHLMDEIVDSLEWRDEGRFIAYYPVTDQTGRDDFERSKVLGVVATREQAKEIADKSNLRAFVWSEPSFLSQFGHSGEKKVIDYERDHKNL